MANLVADKGMDGQTWVIESTDTPIMTWNQVQGSTPNASEVNGTTIAPVPVGKQLVITNCIMLATSTADVQIFNSASSGSATGTQLGQNYIEADEETSVLTQHEVQVRTLNLLEKVAKNLGVK